MTGDGHHHPFELLDYWGEAVEIDTEIVPLMQLLWAHELDTNLSCQDQDGWVWVEFEGPSAEAFVDLVAAHDGELAGDILGYVPKDEIERFDEYKRDHAWRYTAMPLRRGGEVKFVISVRFARSGLDAVVAALEKARQTMGSERA